ncbi:MULTISPECIES: response regulator [Ramlibacter]|uniref:Response regulator n=1 Tax=Ramlibacter aquaticus TaxID=2780094 RepID=A0ABR9SJC0_9BURK|nr:MULTISPECIES: response regulator [Ramlibacter]MBE7942408.1 response regulator [Ramlibacter aquaticus]
MVLLVEDDEDHALLMQLGLETAGIDVDLHLARDGEEALAYLRREGPAHAQAPRPDLVLLDINMPRMDGFQVMEAIAADPALRALPVIVTTTSSDPNDVRRMHALRCTAYWVKPLGFDALVAGLRQMFDFWMRLVVLP